MREEQNNKAYLAICFGETFNIWVVVVAEMWRKISHQAAPAGTTGGTLLQLSLPQVSF